MSIFRSVDDAIFLFDLQSRKITDFNPSVLSLFELKEEEISYLKLNEFSAEDEGYTLKLAREYVLKASEGDAVSFEWRNISRKGRRFWSHNSISIVNIDDVPHILLVCRDIDAQKKMEQSLVESQEHFRALAENSPDIIMRFDREFRHVYVNDAVVAQTGIEVESFLNKNHQEMDWSILHYAYSLRI